ncbi:MAG TPA: hypothetical protein VIY72_11625 [Acidimicrobiales bacterium]
MALLETARSLGLTKGLFGRSRVWLVLGGLAWGIKAIGWSRHYRERTIFRQVVEAGDTLLISATGPPPTRRQHRKSLRVERRRARKELAERIL